MDTPSKPPARHDIDLGADGSISMFVYAALDSAIGTIVLGHGAGAPQTSPFMVTFARGLAERGLTAVTFNFPYTEQRRRVPDRAPALERSFRAVIAEVRARGVGPHGRPLVAGGKSMGGRIATHLAAAHDETAAQIDGLVLLGYPLHPPGRPDAPRSAHLIRIRVPMLVVQGSHDAFGTPDELRPILSPLPRAELFVIEGADHSFDLRRKGPPTRAEIYTTVQDKIARWVASLAPSA